MGTGNPRHVCFGGCIPRSFINKGFGPFGAQVSSPRPPGCLTKLTRTSKLQGSIPRLVLHHGRMLRDQSGTGIQQEALGRHRGCEAE